jgi:hypothetical protein
MAGANPPFRGRIRPRRLDRSLDDPDVGALKYRVECGGELGVAVADEELDRLGMPVEIHQEVSCLLGDPCRSWVGGGPQKVDPAASVFKARSGHRARQARRGFSDTPGRVLPGQAQDKATDVTSGGRPGRDLSGPHGTWRPTGGAASHDAIEDRVRADQKPQSRASWPGDHTGQRSDQSSVGPGQPGLAYLLPLQHSELMP